MQNRCFRAFSMKDSDFILDASYIVKQVKVN